MSDLNDQFAVAAAEAKELSAKPDNADLLRFYALYKQGSSGDVRGDRPGMMDFVGRAKYDAWEALRSMSREEAMQSYIDLVDSLKAG